MYWIEVESVLFDEIANRDDQNIFTPSKLAPLCLYNITFYLIKPNSYQPWNIFVGKSFVLNESYRFC